MPCFSPRKGYRTPSGTVTSSRKYGYADREVETPCGQCIGCRLERSRQWAMRCMHEASLYDDNIFVTLTYSDENLPKDGSLDHTHVQKFMKRLRKKYDHKTIRFYMCGEYGDVTNRPHYHVLLFNHAFSDRVPFGAPRDPANQLYTSETLERLWGFGHAPYGGVTFESAGYCARYTLKKITGDAGEQHYAGRTPPYSQQSRNPGIGKPWLDRWRKDVYPHDYVIVNGRKVKPPKYYDQQQETEELEYAESFSGDKYVHDVFVPRFNRSEIERIKGDRVNASLKYKENNTPERLAVREEVQKRKQSQVKRN